MATDKEAYRTYAGFLQATIRRYHQQGGKQSSFLALLLATKEAWKVAWDEVATVDTGKKVLTGAAGVAVITVLLRVVLGGPLGLLLTGASIASLVALFVKNNESILSRAEHYRGIVARFEPQFEELRDAYVAGTSNESQHQLMVDGLMGRFIEEVDAYKPAKAAPDDEKEERPKDGFAAHAERKKAQEKARKDE